MDERISKEVESEFHIMRVLFSDGTTLFDSPNARVQLSCSQRLLVLYSSANINSFQIPLDKGFLKPYASSYIFGVRGE